MYNISKLKTIIIIVFCVILALLFFLISQAIGIWNYGKTDEKTQADVAIVLGAGLSDGEPSPVFKERINHGIWLYKNGYVDYLIFTGGFGEGSAISDAHATKLYAISDGISEEIIFIEEKSVITEENLEQSKMIMDDNSFKTAVIVSDPLHMKRAMLMAKDYGIEAYSSPTPTTMYKTLKTKLSFLLREEFFYVGYSFVRVFR